MITYLYQKLCKVYIYPDAQALIKERNYEQSYVDEVMASFEHIQKILCDKGMCFCCVTENSGQHPVRKWLQSFGKILSEDVVDDKIMFRFSVNKPDYCLRKKEVISRTIEIELREFQKNHRSIWVHVSRNCTEGQQLFEKYK